MNNTQTVGKTNQESNLLRNALRGNALFSGLSGLVSLFAAQSLACIREFGMADDDPRLNPLGGAIALGHPLGMSGARLVMAAAYQLKRTGGRYALCTMCVGVGQGVALILERV